MSIIGIVIGLIAIGLFFWLKKDQQINYKIIKTNMAKTDKSLIALQEEFTQYQIKTERKISDLEKSLIVKTKEHDRKITKITESLPGIIKKIIGHIEFGAPMQR